MELSRRDPYCVVKEVPTHLAAQFWHAVEQYVAPAMRHHPHMDAADVRSLVLKGAATLCVVLDGADRIIGALVLEQQVYPGKLVGNVIAAGGETGVMASHGSEVEEFLFAWCRTHGIGTAGSLGRQGWSRALASRGWRTQLATLAWKDL